MSIDFNLNIGEDLYIQNSYVVDKDFVKDYNKYCDYFYVDNPYRNWIKKYNKDITSPFFINLENEEIEKLDKCISSEDMIICEDWRDMRQNGSNYYTMVAKNSKRIWIISRTI